LAGSVRLEAAFEVPSDLAYVGPAAGYCARIAREHGFPECVWAENLPLAVDEALTNAMRHGHGLDADKAVRIAIRLGEGRLEIRVEDQGDGFDPDSLPDPRRGDSLYRSGGRGVFLIRNLCDDAHYARGGRSLTMIFEGDGARSED